MPALQRTSGQFEITPPNGEFASLFPMGQASRDLRSNVFFIIVLQGNALIEIDGKGYRLHKGSFLFLSPGHLRLQLSRTEDFRFQHLAFDFDFLSDFPLLLKTDIVNYVTNMPLLSLDSPDFERLNTYYGLINDRYRDSGSSPEVIKGLLFSFILEVSRIYSGQNISVEVSRQDELVDGFFGLLHTYCKRKRTAAFYADKLCVSDKHLMRTIKLKTGQTFHFWMADFVLREAKVLLKSTDESVTQIADRLNFPNSSFFARFFRRYTNLSPLQFRKR